MASNSYDSQQMSKRALLQLSAAGSAAAVMSLLSGSMATAMQPTDSKEKQAKIGQLPEIFGNISNIITSISLLLGIIFTASAIFKFRQHKLNPTQPDWKSFLDDWWSATNGSQRDELIAEGFTLDFVTSALEDLREGDTLNFLTLVEFLQEKGW